MSAPYAHAACDRAIAHSVRPGPTEDAHVEHPRLLLATTILASSLAFIDGSVVNVALPAIGRSLAAGGGGLSWVVNGYTLPLSALLLIGGAAGDVFGRRRLLIAGVALFALASALCALAPSLVLLISGRVLQGIGAALLMPNSLAILGASFRGEARGRAIGTWAAIGAAAGAVGPILGGYLIDFVGWRMIFLINLPIACGAIALATRCVRRDPAVGTRRLDWLGATLAALALTALTWGLTVASASKGIEVGASAALLFGALTLLAFVWFERRKGDGAMLPLSLFSSRSFVGLTLLTLFLYGALGGLLVLVPFVLIEANHYSATAAGAALLPLPVVIAACSSAMGQLAGRVGSRLPLTLGPLIVAVGCMLALRIGEPGPYWTTTLPAMLVISIGMAGAVAPLTHAVLGSVDGQHTGVASGFNSAVARTGGLVAVSFISALLAARGSALLALFRGAALVGAAVCAAAGISALVCLPAAREGSR
jgi:EmrB/QacA subfamily drug resistance transporter